jgi:subtilisin-like proprotein convertase family protein
MSIHRTMKIQIGICFLLLFSIDAARANECPDDSYDLSTQREVDRFPQGCSEIRGLLNISDYGHGDQDAITSLANLSNLRSVGRLQIGDTQKLESLVGLNGVELVTGGTRERCNEVSIGDNQALMDLSGLDGLRVVKGSLKISRNPSLVSLKGLNALSTVGIRNEASCQGNFLIFGNNALTDLSPLASLTSVTRNVSIIGNKSLQSLTGLSNLASQELFIQDNESLKSLEGALGIKPSSYVSVKGNNLLKNLKGLNAIEGLTGSLLVSGKTIDSLDGLENLRFVGAELRIYVSSEEFSPEQTAVLVDSSAIAHLQAVGTSSAHGKLHVGNFTDESLLSFARILGWPEGPPSDGVEGEIKLNSRFYYGQTAIADILHLVGPPLETSIKSVEVGSKKAEFSLAEPKATQAIEPNEFEVTCTGAVEFKEADVLETIDDVGTRVFATAVDEDIDLTNAKLRLFLDIEHDYMETLTVVLRSPNGTEVTIFDRDPSYIGRPYIDAIFPTTFWPKDSFENFKAQSSRGSWELLVTDHSEGRQGLLVSWGLELTEHISRQSHNNAVVVDSLRNDQPYQCDAAVVSKYGNISTAIGLEITPRANQNEKIQTRFNSLLNALLRAHKGA